MAVKIVKIGYLCNRDSLFGLKFYEGSPVW